jgi:hypothetical protein
MGLRKDEEIRAIFSMIGDWRPSWLLGDTQISAPESLLKRPDYTIVPKENRKKGFCERGRLAEGEALLIKKDNLQRSLNSNLRGDP